MSKSLSLASGYVIVVGVSVMLANALPAQDVQRLSRQLDVARERKTEADRAIAAHQRTRDLRPTVTDTLHFAGGSATVLTEKSLVPVVQQAVARTDSILRTSVGSAASVLGDARFSVVTDTTQAARDGQTELAYHPPRGGSINRLTAADPAAISRELTNFSTDLIIDRNKTPFSLWRRGTLILDRDEARKQASWGAIRLEMVSSISFVDHRCYEGDLAACAISLGLRPTTDPATERFDSAGRRALVRLNEDGLRRVDASATRSCLEGSDAKCRNLLRVAPAYAERIAMSFGRSALVQQALEMGGDLAAERLITNTGNASDALAAAARVPMDSLLHVWQQNVRAQEVRSQSLSIHLVLVALGWVAVLAVLAMRSSRWR